ASKSAFRIGGRPAVKKTTSSEIKERTVSTSPDLLAASHVDTNSRISRSSSCMRFIIPRAVTFRGKLHLCWQNAGLLVMKLLLLPVLVVPLCAQDALSLRDAVLLGLKQNKGIAAADAGEAPPSPTWTRRERASCPKWITPNPTRAATIPSSSSVLCSHSTSSALRISTSAP